MLPNSSGQGYQEFIVGTSQRDSTLANATSQCELFGYTPAQATLEVLRVVGVVNGWRAHFEACGVTRADLKSLAQWIDGDRLLGQRQSFNPGAYSAPKRQSRRRRPFAR